VFVHGDLWTNIVLDLLFNAFKFIFDGSIRIETRDQNHLVELMFEMRLAS
jgi:hypothetical protein